MAISGSGVSVAVGVQADADTEAATVYGGKLTQFSEGPGRQVYSGEPEIAGGLYANKTALVVGAVPRFSMGGIVRTSTFMQLLLNGAGFLKHRTGDGSTTPYVNSMQPVTSAADWKYLTLNTIYDSTAKYSMLGARLAQLSMDFEPGGPPRWRGSGIGLNHAVSALTQTADTGFFEPVTVETPTSAVDMPDAMSTRLYSFGFDINTTLDDSQVALGNLFLDDNTPTAMIITIRGLINMSADDYASLLYGDEALTTLGGALVTGSLSYQCEAPGFAGADPYDDVQPYIKITCSAAKLWMDTEVEVDPQRPVQLPFTGICTGTFGVEFLNGTDFAAIS